MTHSYTTSGDLTPLSPSRLKKVGSQFNRDIQET